MTHGQKGDLAEYRVLMQALERNISVLKPIGNNLPYDLVFDINGKLIKIQVKQAWKKKNSYIVSTRRSLTNRTIFKVKPYKKTDFDYLIAVIPTSNDVYIIPINIVCSYGNGISLEGTCAYRSKKNILQYKNSWKILG